MQNQSMAENMPYMFVPALIAMQMFVNNFVKENYSLPDDDDPEEKSLPINVDWALPFLMGGAALATPQIISLNWLAALSL